MTRDFNAAVREVSFITVGPTLCSSGLDAIVADTGAFFSDGIDHLFAYLARDGQVYTTRGVVQEVEYTPRNANPNAYHLRKRRSLLDMLKMKGHLIDVTTQNLPEVKHEDRILKDLEPFTSKALAYSFFMWNIEAIHGSVIQITASLPAGNHLPHVVAQQIVQLLNADISEPGSQNLSAPYAVLRRIYAGSLNKYHEEVWRRARRFERKHSEARFEGNVDDLLHGIESAFHFLIEDVVSAVQRYTSLSRMARNLQRYWQERPSVDRKVVLLSYAYQLPDIQPTSRVGVYSSDGDVRELLALRQNLQVVYSPRI